MFFRFQSKKLRARRLNRIAGSDDLLAAGDFYLVRSLGSIKEEFNPHSAIILKCPFCSRDMASTPFVKIREHHSWLQKLLNKEAVVSALPMLQCPYDQSHKFKIKKGKIIPL